jgi:L-ascorbate metabolism protein UlaG (beta-lactamase superfamily)
MDIYYYGANCVRLVDKSVSILIDDNLDALGLKKVTKPEDICIYTNNLAKKAKGRFLIDGPGEYEISDVSISGIPAQAHIDKDGEATTIYAIELQNFKVAVLGHISPDITDDQIESLGVVDILIIPVGGNGFTLDSNAAAHIIKNIEPKIVIPTHYEDEAIKYEVPQSSLDNFLKEMGVTEPEILDSLRVKESDMTDKARIVVLARQKTK